MDRKSSGRGLFFASARVSRMVAVAAQGAALRFRHQERQSEAVSAHQSQLRRRAQNQRARPRKGAPRHVRGLLLSRQLRQLLEAELHCVLAPLPAELDARCLSERVAQVPDRRALRIECVFDDP
jgi:hypothetical protein